MTRRVVITGMGTINSLSSDLKSFWHGLCAGRSGIGTIEQFDTSAFKVHFGGEVKDFKPEDYLDTKTARRLDRFAQLLHRDVEPVLLDHEQFHAGRVAGLDHGVGIRQRQGHRLFNDDVLAVLGQVNDMLGMTAALGKNDEYIAIYRFSHFIHVCEYGNIELIANGLSFFKNNIANSD